MSALESWGDRPACLPPSTETSAAVLLAEDLQNVILDILGVLGFHLAAINNSWTVLVSAKRKAWRLLSKEPGVPFARPAPNPNRDHWKHTNGGGPFDVCSLPEGDVCVADTALHLLFKLNARSTISGCGIGSEQDGSGLGPGLFRSPYGVACDGTSLYVADTFNHRVQKLRLADCAHLGTVGNADCTKGGGEGQFADPSGMCVAGDTLYVCDSKNNRIVVLSIDLSWR